MRALLFLVIAVPALAQTWTVPGTGVRIPVPAGLALTSDEQGIQHLTEGARIHVERHEDSSYVAFRAVAHPDSLREQGIADPVLTDTLHGGSPALWASGVFAASAEWRVLVIDSGDDLVTVMGLVARDQTELLGVVEQAVWAVEIDAPPEAPPAAVFEGYPFHATPPSELGEIRRLPRAVEFSSGSPSLDARVELSIGTELGAPLRPDQDLDVLARRRLSRGLHHSDVRGEVETRELRVGDVRGAEAVSRGTNLRDDAERLFYVALIPRAEPGAYVVVEGVGVGPDVGRWLGVFRASARSVRPRDAPAPSPDEGF